jgi:hypothetical protein
MIDLLAIKAFGLTIFNILFFATFHDTAQHIHADVQSVTLHQSGVTSYSVDYGDGTPHNAITTLPVLVVATAPATTGREEAPSSIEGQLVCMLPGSDQIVFAGYAADFDVLAGGFFRWVNSEDGNTYYSNLPCTLSE